MSYSSEVLADSPVAYWRLGEASGTAGGDASGNGHALTYGGAFALGQAGALVGDADAAVRFGGTGQGYGSVTGAAIADIGAAADFAFEWWCKTTGAMDVTVFTAAGLMFGIGLAADGRIKVNLYGDGAYRYGATAVNDGAWHHCVVERAAGTYRFYVDGVPDATDATAPPATFFMAAAILGCGAVGDDPSSFIGTLDEVALYAAALGATRVAAHHAAGHPPPPAFPLIVDDAGPGFATAGASWTTFNQGYLGDEHFTPAAPAHAATWHFTGLPAGPYAVGLTWVPAGDRATNIAWALKEGGTTLASGVFSQRHTPTDFTIGGIDGDYLGSATIAGTTLDLVVTAGSDGLTIADAAYLVPLADITSNPTKQDGDWNTAATWKFGVPSGTVPAAIGHDVTVTTDTTWGDGSDATILTMTVTNAGTLTITGCTFTLRGHFLIGDPVSAVFSTITVESTPGHPAALLFDCEAGVTPLMRFDSLSKIIGAGTVADPVTIATRAGTAGNPVTSSLEPAAASAGCADLRHCTLRRLGGWAASLSGPGAPFLMDHCTVDACTNTPNVIITHGGANFEITASEWLANNGTDCFGVNATGAAAITGGGTRIIHDNLFDAQPGFWAACDFTVTGNYFDDDLQVFGGANWREFSGNLFRKTGNRIIGGGGGADDNYFLYDSDNPGAYLWLCNPEDSTFSRNVIQFVLGGASQPVCWLGTTHSAGAPTRTMTLVNNLMIPPQGAAAGSCFLLNPISDVIEAPLVTNLYVLDHNTICTVGHAPVEAGREFSSKPGAVTSLRSNLLHNTGSPAHLFEFVPLVGTTTPLDVITHAGGSSDADYNAHLGMAAATGNVGTVPLGAAEGTVYSTPLTVVPGPHDLADVDPGFVADGRRLEAWDASLGGPGTLPSALARLRADRALIPVARDWVKAGFPVTNPALRDAGHDGVTIGALPFLGAATGYTLDAPTPAEGYVGVASGDFTVAPDGAITGTVTPADGGAGGTFTPPALTWAAEADARAFTYTPAAAGPRTIAGTNTAGIADPAPVSYLALSTPTPTPTGTAGPDPTRATSRRVGPDPLRSTSRRQ